MKKLFANNTFLIVAWCIVVLIISACAFLFNGDGGATGAEIIANQTANEWFWMIFGSVMVGVVIYLACRYYRKVQDMPGNVLRGTIAAIMIFMGIAFGKAMTDKANDGVTSGNGRIGGPAQVDSSRVAAEDLLPKKK